MASTRRTNEPPRRRRPATTPEAREQQLVSDAYDLAEKQIAAGTASSQTISHFLKLGSSREKLEQERLAVDNELSRVKMEAIQSHQRIEELYSDAIKAMRSYRGDGTAESEDEQV